MADPFGAVAQRDGATQLWVECGIFATTVAIQQLIN
jgi:hypothetical protein